MLLDDSFGLAARPTLSTAVVTLRYMTATLPGRHVKNEPYAWQPWDPRIHRDSGSQLQVRITHGSRSEVMTTCGHVPQTSAQELRSDNAGHTFNRVASTV